MYLDYRVKLPPETSGKITVKTISGTPAKLTYILIGSTIYAPYSFVDTEEEFRDCMNQLNYEVDFLEGKVKTIPINTILNKCGFPDNWSSIVSIDK